MGGVTTLRSRNDYQVSISGNNYYRRGATVTLNDEDESLAFRDNEDDEIIAATQYSALYLGDVEPARPFASYGELKEWVTKHMLFKGIVVADGTSGAFLVDGRAYGKGTVEPVYDNDVDVNPGCITLISLSGRRILANVHYSRLYVERDNEPIEDYETLVRWIADFTFIG